MTRRQKLKRFWTIRLIIICAQVPVIVWLQMTHERWLVPYLIWMSWATWLSSELPTGGRGEGDVG